jgi:hypothetical protein
MIVVVQGTKSFDDYQTFLAGMRTALLNRNEDDKTFTVFSAGPLNINNMAMEFVNISERTLKAKGIKTKLVKIPPSWIADNHYDIDFFAYYCNRKEDLPIMVQDMNAKDVNVQIYRP